MPKEKRSKQTRTTIYATVYGGFILLSAYLIGHNYQLQLQYAEKGMQSELYSIASTLSQYVEGDSIRALFQRYPLNTDATDISTDRTYQQYQSLFARTKDINNLKTPIYTLTYDSVTDRFIGGVASNGLETYGWHYQSPPEQLYELYHTGGTIPRFQDDHGTWLSAVYPIKDSSGNVVAVIEADYPFDSFIEEARNDLIRNLLFSILVMAVIGIVTYPILNRILRNEERSKAELQQANALVLAKNEEMQSSLEYARTMQELMLPLPKHMKMYFSACMVLNLPRDTVSGDFYWFHQLDDARCLLAVADCTGHGVPGALMSMMGNDYLDHIVNEQGVCSPAKILELLNRKIESAFMGFDRKTAHGTDGMDVGICLVDSKKGEILFSGARRPLTMVKADRITHIKGTRRSIGEHFLASEVAFEETRIPLESNTTYYLYSDGLQDQFGGANAKRLMKKGLEQWFLQAQAMPMEKRRQWLYDRFVEWKGDNLQVDDICVIAFQV